MNRPQKVNQIYLELRAELGDKIPAHELLRSAALLVAVVKGDGPATGAVHHSPRATFDEKPLDEAMADGGWKILARESSWLHRIDGDDTPSVKAKEQLRSYGLELAA